MLLFGGCLELFEPKSQSSMLLAFTQHGHTWTKQIQPLRTDVETENNHIEIQGELVPSGKLT